MAEHAPEPSAGLLHSLGGLAATLMAMAHTRLELLSADLDEEREHLLALLVLTLGALFCLGVGIVLMTILIVSAFWDSHRLLALGILAGCFMLGAIAAWRGVIGKARRKPRLFAVSLAELGKDREHLAAPR